MAHARQQIRDAVVIKLKEITTFGNRVYTDKTSTHKELPDVMVITSDEVINYDESTKTTQTRILTLNIEPRVKDETGLNDALDNIAVSVEKKLLEDESMGGLITALQMVGTEIVFDGETNQPTGEMRIEYEAWYRVNPLFPETIIT